MLTEYEAQKLRHDMRKELNAGPGMVLACAVCLVVAAVLALIAAPPGAMDHPATMVLTAPAQLVAPQGAADHVAKVSLTAPAQSADPQ